MEPITRSNFDTLWNFQKPAETEEKFRELLSDARKSPPYHAELLTQIARTHGLRAEFDTAHAILDEAETIIEDLGPDEQPRPKIRYLLERGRATNSSGNPKAARPFFQKAWDLGRAVKEDILAVDAAHMIAIVETPEESIQWNLNAAEYARNSSNKKARGWLGALYNNIGVAYLQKEDYENSLKYYELQLDWYKTNGGSPRMLRIARWCVARAIRGLGDYEKALEEQLEIERLWEEAGEPGGYALEEIGECLLALGRTTEAAPYFARAHEILSKDVFLSRNEPDRLERLQRLGSAAASETSEGMSGEATA